MIQVKTPAFHIRLKPPVIPHAYLVSLTYQSFFKD